jgi:hypothetical protein
MEKNYKDTTSKFSTTIELMELLESGEYKRPVMENDGEDAGLSSGDEALAKYNARISHPNNYDYITSRNR